MGGEEALKEALENVHKRGKRAIFYINGQLIDEHVPSVGGAAVGIAWNGLSLFGIGWKGLKHYCNKWFGLSL